MKKLVKIIGIASVLGAFAFTTASCSHATESYANKINDEAKDDDGEYITYEKAKKALGKECIDLTVTVLGSSNGALVAVKGCKSTDDIQKKIDDGEEVKGIVITVLNNNCTSAVYKTISTSDLKKSN